LTAGYEYESVDLWGVPRSPTNGDRFGSAKLIFCLTNRLDQDRDLRSDQCPILFE
jgi:hypothetical protein